MALSFLQAAGTLVPIIGSMFSRSSKTPKATAAQRALEQNVANQSYLARALVDPSNELYKRLGEEERNYSRSLFARQLRDLLVANQRASIRGRAPLIDPERRDETAFNLLANNERDLGIKADEVARSRIASALSGMQGQAQGLSSIDRISRDLDIRQRDVGLQRYSNIGSLLSFAGNPEEYGRNRQMDEFLSRIYRTG